MKQDFVVHYQVEGNHIVCVIRGFGPDGSKPFLGKLTMNEAEFEYFKNCIGGRWEFKSRETESKKAVERGTEQDEKQTPE